MYLFSNITESFAAVREASGNTYSDKEVPNKTTNVGTQEVFVCLREEGGHLPYSCFVRPSYKIKTKKTTRMSCA